LLILFKSKKKNSIKKPKLKDDIGWKKTERIKKSMDQRKRVRFVELS
jgi:hypothetical protein